VERSADWLAQAEENLAAARDQQRTGHHAWACFAAQQAAEGALKALLERYRLAVPGHNLLDLLARLPADLGAAALQQSCVRLNLLYIPTRYPDAFPSGVPAAMFTEESADEAINDAERVLAFARPLVHPPPP
jgi:HEPN domain-containing protein